MRANYLAGIVLTSVLLAGCATGRSTQQADVAALNARLSALEGQLASKDQEIAALQNQVNDERLAREAAETALRSASAQQSAKKTAQSDLK